MSFVKPSTIQQLAESLAIQNITEDAAKALAPHIDVRLREIIQEASKFSRHSKRSFLTSQDINNALRFHNCEAVHGFAGRDPARFVKAAGHTDLFYIEDLEVPIQQMIEAPLPKVPVEVGVVPHWLAIDGAQPNTPHHPPADRQRVKRKRAETSQPVSTKQRRETGEQTGKQQEGGKQDAEQQPAVVIPPIRQLLSIELKVYLERIRKLLEDTRSHEGADADFGGLPGSPAIDPGGPSTGAGVGIATRIAEARAVLASLADDPGLQPLTPTLVDLIIQQVKDSMKHLPQLHLLIKMARSMLRNEGMQVELYLHKLISPLMTCMVTKRLGDSPGEDHWSVRVAAAEAVATVCRQFGGKYVDLQQRICRQLASALTDESKPITTRYGALQGLARMGNRTVEVVVLPNLATLLNHLKPALESSNKVAAAEARQMEGALRHACASCMYHTLTTRLSKAFFAHLQMGALPPATAQLDFHAEGKPTKAATSQPARKKGRGGGAARGPTKSKRGSSTKSGKAKAGATSSDVTSQPANPDGGAVEEGDEKLEDVWREGTPLGKQLSAVHALFGTSVQPYTPGAAIEQVFF